MINNYYNLLPLKIFFIYILIILFLINRIVLKNCTLGFHCNPNWSEPQLNWLCFVQHIIIGKYFFPF